MRAVVQRVTEARVRVGERIEGEIVHGLLVLVVSQFTLYGDNKKGRRPSFEAAASPTDARAIYLDLVRELRRASLPVATGEFQVTMRVELINNGPVTILIDSTRQF